MIPKESYSSDDFLLYQIGKSYTLPLFCLDQKLAIGHDNNGSKIFESNKDSIISSYHNKIYDILATTCIRKWWVNESSKYTAEDILSYNGDVHRNMKIKLPRY